ncbi:hypothetical protein I3760_12G108600 [Carya illinoinensis]|nr:hypothetical protein I3760_12G108600 [Carya illinoinensis]
MRNLRVWQSYWDVSMNSLDLWNIYYFMVVLPHWKRLRIAVKLNLSSHLKACKRQVAFSVEERRLSCSESSIWSYIPRTTLARWATELASGD